MPHPRAAWAPAAAARIRGRPPSWGARQRTRPANSPAPHASACGRRAGRAQRARRSARSDGGASGKWRTPPCPTRLPPRLRRKPAKYHRNTGSGRILRPRACAHLAESSWKPSGATRCSPTFTAAHVRDTLPAGAVGPVGCWERCSDCRASKEQHGPCLIAAPADGRIHTASGDGRWPCS